MRRPYLHEKGEGCVYRGAVVSTLKDCVCLETPERDSNQLGNRLELTKSWLKCVCAGVLCAGLRLKGSVCIVWEVSSSV